MAKTYKFVIVGQGLLGIHLSLGLEDSIILEKSKNVGGRFSSRRFDGGFFNFGVQSFEWDGVFFFNEIELGFKEGLLKKEEDKIYPTGTFNEWTKSLSQNLNVKQFEVISIREQNSKYLLVSKNSEEIIAQNIILTAPAPQSYNMIKDLGDYSHLLDVEYSKEIFYMFTSLDSSQEHHELDIISISEKKDMFFYFCKLKTWSEKTREEIKEDLDQKLLPIESFAHKWRYCRVLKPTIYKQVHDNIFCLGDYYMEGLKGSYESASHFKKLFELTF